MIGASGYDGVWAGPAGMELDYHYIAGCEVAWLSTSTVQIGVGEARSDDDTSDIVVTGALTLDITNTGLNGRNVDTAEQADKWYAVYLILNPTTGIVGGQLVNEDDIPGWTLPAGFTKTRRVGWVRNNSSSNLRNFFTDGDGHFRQIFWRLELSARNVLNSGSSTGWSNVDCSEFIPPTSITGWFEHYFDPYSTDQFETRANGEGYTFMWMSESVLGSGAMWICNCDSSQIIEYRVGSVLSDLWIYAMGYIDVV